MECGFIMTNGNQCKANHMNGSKYCFRHDPNKKEERLIASSNGGKNRALKDSFGQRTALNSPNDIRNFLGQVINDTWTGKIPVTVGNSMGFLAKCWLEAHTASETQMRVEMLEKRLNNSKL